MAQTFLGPEKRLRGMGSSCQGGLIMVPGQEAKSDDLGVVFDFSTQYCMLYSLVLPR